MKVLVTGGTGFVGSALCEELASRGHEVAALARDPGEADFEAEVETVRGDVTDYDSIEPHFAGRDAVVHLVALSPLFRPSGGDERHLDVHVGGTENAVRAAEDHDVGTFLQMSGVHADPNADTAYLRAKGLAEDVVRGSDLDWIVFRPTVMFGDGDEFRSFTKLVAPPYLAPLPDGGSQRFQLLWIEDGVSLLADALEGRTGDGTAAGTDDAGAANEAADADASTDESPADVDENAEEEPAPDDPDDDDAEEPDDDEAGVPDENPHHGETYEIGGPEVQSFADLVRLTYAAEHKPVKVLPLPLPLADIGLTLLGAVGGPLGGDQAKSLRKDLVVAHNDVDALGVDAADLRTYADYLGVTPEYVAELNRLDGA